MNENKSFTQFISSDVSFEMRFIQGGVFQMGSNEYDDEKPIYPVTVSSFYMSNFLVTQSLYESIMQKNPSRFQGLNRPVERVSWDDAKLFIQKLNKKTGKEFSLASEAEWEYAAKGGIYSQGYDYAGSDDLKQVGWYSENSGQETKPVGLLLPNELGLYDMSGNLYEWCEDDWHHSYKDSPDDGSAWVDTGERASYRVMRGGGYFCYSFDCRPSIRDYYQPVNRSYDLGFRLVLSLQFR